MHAQYDLCPVAFHFRFLAGFGADFPEACFDEGKIEALADLSQAAAEGLAGQGAHLHRGDTLFRIIGLARIWDHKRAASVLTCMTH
jgi:hypothetical protein